MRFSKATAGWLEKHFPKKLANVQTKNDGPSELVATGSLVEALRQECETSHTALADEKQKAELATAAAKEAEREAALPTSPTARNERARILGILGLESAKIPGAINPSHKFDDLLAGWAADPAMPLEEATKRFDDIWGAFDLAQREQFLEKLKGDEAALDAPAVYWGGPDGADVDDASRIRSACDEAHRAGALGPPPTPDRLSDLVAEVQTRIARGERL